jgi:hypothetical protein
VRLVSGRFRLSKTIIPDAQEHFLTPSARRDTHLFGGLGISQKRSDMTTTVYRLVPADFALSCDTSSTPEQTAVGKEKP